MVCVASFLGINLLYQLTDTVSAGQIFGLFKTKEDEAADGKCCKECTGREKRTHYKYSSIRLYYQI
jgi:hypothetical protein